MTIEIAQSNHADASEAVAELRAAVRCSSPRLVVFFSSSAHDPNELGAALLQQFGAVPSIGCTTAGEMVSGAMLKNSVVMAVFDESALKSAHVALVANPTRENAVREALDSLAASAGAATGAALDPRRYVGVVLHDGLGAAEERVMAELSARTNVAFVGGSAGDDAKFESTQVFAGFQPAGGASVLALLEPTRRFDILKTQSFKVGDQVLEVTDVDEEARTVRCFDGDPAAVAYARALGVEVGELPGSFQRSPLGLVMPDGEPYVRSPQRVSGTDVVFYCQVAKGMKLRVLESVDIVDQTRRDLAAKLAEFGAVSAVINFNCILRTLELEANGQCDAYAKLFEVPMVGFSTYGESYVGHINQTSTMLLFE